MTGIILSCVVLEISKRLKIQLVSLPWSLVQLILLLHSQMALSWISPLLLYRSLCALSFTLYREADAYVEWNPKPHVASTACFIHVRYGPASRTVGIFKGRGVSADYDVMYWRTTSTWAPSKHLYSVATKKSVWVLLELLGKGQQAPDLLVRLTL